MFSGRLVSLVWRPLNQKLAAPDRLAAHAGLFKYHFTAATRDAAGNALQKHLSALRYKDYLLGILV